MNTPTINSQNDRFIDLSAIKQIGIVGAGAIGQALAKHLARADFSVVLSNRRGPDSLADLVKQLGPHTTAGTLRDAAAADLVILSTPWTELDSVASGIGPLNGRVVIDATNAVMSPGFKPAELGGRASTELVSERLTGARVVKTFNTLLADVLADDPRQGDGRRVMFVSGNDDGAKQVVINLVERLGFAGIDLGSLAVGGKLQQFPGGPLPALNLLRI